jgi:hypothetical protein
MREIKQLKKLYNSKACYFDIYKGQFKYLSNYNNTEESDTVTKDVTEEFIIELAEKMKNRKIITQIKYNEDEELSKKK